MWLPPELWEIIYQYKKDIEEYEEIKQNKKNVVNTINKYTVLIDNEDYTDDAVTYYEDIDLELIDYPLYYMFLMFVYNTI